MALLRLHEVGKRYGSSRALQRVSFEVAEGDFRLLLGSNGAGKSTLLRCLMGLERIDSGSIHFDSLSVSSTTDYRQILRDYRPAYLGAEHGLYSHLSGKENLDLRAALAGTQKEHKAREQIVKRFELGDFLHKRISECSQGMQRRVALACSFIVNPRIVFFDEPFVNLDKRSSTELKRALLESNARGVTVCLATHAETFSELGTCTSLTLEKGRIVQ